jgi:hypothetical protein
MAQVLQLRRGTTAQNDVFTGAIAEVVVDTDKNYIRVHDGVTMGGHELGDVFPSTLPSAASVAGSDEVLVRQGGVTKKATKTLVLNGIVNANIDAAAAISDTKLATISTALKVSNSATTATSANTASAIVARDASNNFSAGTITANLTGNASGSAGTLANSHTISLTGDVTGTTAAFNGSADVSAATTIANDAVTTAKILNGSVTNDKLASDIDAAKLTTGTLPADRIGSGAITPAKLSQPYTQMTAKAFNWNGLSNTAIDFDGIPTWAKQITLMFDRVSLNLGTNLLIQLGDPGGIENTGYFGGGARITSAAIAAATFSTGFGFNAVTANNQFSGSVIITNFNSNTWTASGNLGGITTEFVNVTSGSKTLSGGPLDTIRITSDGASVFDGGTINVSYVG